MLSVAAIALGTMTSAASAAEATLTNVHVCCNSCKKGINAAVTGAGATAKIEKTTVTVTAADDAGVKKAVDALLAAGYYGDGATAAEAPSDAKAKSVTVEGVHLCCGKCVDAFNKAVKTAAKAPGQFRASTGAMSPSSSSRSRYCAGVVGWRCSTRAAGS